MNQAQPASTLPRRQLREWRSRAHLTRAAAARLVEMSPSALQRIETGVTTRIRPRDIEALCDVFGVPPEMASAFVGLARQPSVQSWLHKYGEFIPSGFNVYVGLEAVARGIFSYQPELILGLLQTPQYMLALLRAAKPGDTPEEWNRWVEMKIRRQTIIKRRTRPARVLPLSVGLPAGISMPPFILLRFGEPAPGEPAEPPIVYLEGVVGDIYLERPEDVAIHNAARANLRKAALDEGESKALLRRVAREYEASS